MTRVIGVLNAGSSSVKFSVFAVAGADLRRLYRGVFEGIGTAPHLFVSDKDGAIVVDERDSLAEVATQEDAVHRIFTWVESHDAGLEVVGVGHRVVHGGPIYSEPVVIDGPTLDALAAFEPLAPSHQPHNLAPIRALIRHRPGLSQVACFDTAFHRTAPLVADIYALPREYLDAGVRRYGFHGLSFEYVTQALRALDPVAAAGRVVIAHLGNGCSMAAVLAGKSLGDTMGFTALDGLPMGTRCGQIDPGVLIYLLRQRGMSVDRMEDLLYNHSGLKGLSGVSNDMRDLLASDVPDARLAVDYFIDRIGRELGSLAAVLKGLDALVFTAGIGEHATEVRAGLPRRGLAGRHARRRGQSPRWTSNLPGRALPLGLGHPDRRRTDDRPAHPPAPRWRGWHAEERRVRTMIARLDGTLEGRKGLVVGIANAHSIAYGCARAFRALGAELAVTYLNDKARPYVEPLAQELQAPIFLPCDVQDDAQVDGLFEAIRQRWGRLDFALHAVAFAPKPDLQGRLTDSSREGFLMAMDISCHSFIRLARRAEPLMTDGGVLLTLSFAGAERVVQNYDLMGPVKAALECAVRYLAYELGPKGIRVHALSPGPIHTRAASGLKDFDAIVLEEQRKAPLGRLAEIDDVGAMAAFLASPAASAITGMTIYVDGGYHIMG